MAHTHTVVTRSLQTTPALHSGPHFKMLFCAPSLVAYLLVADRLLDDADLDENGPLRDQGARWKL
eukprot:scaffold117503_cov69-Phaeocystis_antarctica.AAC.3